MSSVYQDDDQKSFKGRSDCLLDARRAKSENKRSRLRRKRSSCESSSESCKQEYSSPEKHQLRSPSKVSNHPQEGQEAGISSLSNSSPANNRPNVLSKATSDCEQMLRQIIRTAYQFTRHSHREKLTLNDLEKAFKIHRVDMKPDDVDKFIDKNDIDLIGDGND